MGTVITVEKGFFSRYSSITKALQAAATGDTIVVKPGCYNEAIVLDKSVEIRAAQAGVTVECQNDHTFQITAEKAVVRGLTIRQLGGTDKVAVMVTSGNSLFEDCRMQSQSSSAVLLLNATTNPLFKNCTVAGNQSGGVKVTEKAQGCFENCRIFDNKSSNVSIHNEADPMFIHCELFDSQGNGVWVCDSGRGRFQDCEIHGNTFPNVGIKTNGNPRFEQCKIYESQQHGVWVHDSGAGQLLNCEIYRNSYANVAIQTNSNPRFEQCKIYESQQSGVWVLDSGAGQLLNCEIYRNSYPNIDIKTNSNPRFEQCKIYESQQNGVWVYDSGLGQFLSCDIYQNSADPQYPNIGIKTAGNPSFEQCTIHDSIGWSIYCADNGLGHFIACEMARSALANVAVSTGANPLFETCRIHSGQQEGIWVREEGLGKFLNCNVYGNAAGNLRIESSQTTNQNCTETEPPSIEAVLKELDALIGLESVKTQIRKTIQFIEFNKEVSQYGVNVQDVKQAASHTVLSGNPGTGKTTIARLLGRLYAVMGLLPSGHVVSVNREKLVAQYIGQTAPKTKEWIEQAAGGILFIDEAYELANKGERDFGPEAIAVILEEMENRRGEFIVVIAGYSEEIKQFLEINPGLKSRFNQYFTLEDYSPEEMRQIAEKLYRDKQRTITPDGLRLLVQEFTQQWRKRDRFFANARMVRNLVELSLQQQAERCMATERKMWNQEFLTTVTDEDIQAVLPTATGNPYVLPIQEKDLAEAAHNLDQLIGLQTVKSEIHKLVTLVRYYREEGKDIEALSPHTVLKGSPGTGKTEVARIIASIYAALGILERGDLIEVNRDKLVRPHAGESEKVTAQFIEQAMGGVLFIDEAYQLTQYGPSDPGHKVVEVLLKYMEDRRGKFIVIAAGYSAQMDQFLESNDGLRRRFARQLEFEDYTADELMQISAGLLLKSGYYLEETASQALKDYFTRAYRERDRSFGNAGFARNVITETIKNTDYRVAMTPKEQRTPEFNKRILCEDIAAGM